MRAAGDVDGGDRTGVEAQLGGGRLWRYGPAWRGRLRESVGPLDPGVDHDLAYDRVDGR